MRFSFHSIMMLGPLVFAGCSGSAPPERPAGALQTDNLRLSRETYHASRLCQPRRGLGPDGASDPAGMD